MSEYNIEELGNGQPRTHLVISPTVLVTLIGSAIALGFGLGNAANEYFKGQSASACVQNYQDAMQQLNEFERQLDALRRHVDTRTGDRWLGEDQRRYARTVETRLSEHERTLQRLEAYCARSGNYRFDGGGSNGGG